MLCLKGYSGVNLIHGLTLGKLAICKLDLLRGGSYSVSRCVKPWIKFTPEYPFKDTWTFWAGEPGIITSAINQ